MSKHSGLLFLYTFGLIFITLKLMGYITWSWWLVLAPFWILPAIGLLVFVSAFVAVLIDTLLKDK